MSDVYDLGHLYRFMQAVSAASRAYGAGGRISLSIHCEQPEIIRTMIDEVKAERQRGSGGVQSGAAALSGAAGDRRSGAAGRPDALPGQPAAPVERRSAGRRPQGAPRLPGPRRPARDDAAPPVPDLRHRARRHRVGQSQPAHPRRRRQRGAVAAASRAATSSRSPPITRAAWRRSSTAAPGRRSLVSAARRCSTRCWSAKATSNAACRCSASPSWWPPSRRRPLDSIRAKAPSPSGRTRT